MTPNCNGTRKLKSRFAEPWGLCLLIVAILVLCQQGEVFTQSAASLPEKKHIRLHVIAFGMKNQTKGLQQLKAVSDAGHGKFSTADNFQQLEEVFTNVAEDTTTTIIVEWPGRDSGSSLKSYRHKSSKQPGPWDNPWTLGLSIVLTALILATAAIAYLKFRPTYRLHLMEPSHDARKVTFYRKSIWLGRDPSCNITIQDPCVSRRHLRITVAKKGIGFADNKTENGSFIDGKRVKQGFLPFGNRMTIGKTEVQVMKQK